MNNLQTETLFLSTHEKNNAINYINFGELLRKITSQHKITFLPQFLIKLKLLYLSYNRNIYGFLMELFGNFRKMIGYVRRTFGEFYIFVISAVYITNKIINGCLKISTEIFYWSVHLDEEILHISDFIV